MYNLGFKEDFQVFGVSFLRVVFIDDLRPFLRIFLPHHVDGFPDVVLQTIRTFSARGFQDFGKDF